MRKLLCVSMLCILLLCVLAHPLNARADVIYDPIGDMIDSASGVMIAVGILCMAIAVITGIVILLIVLLKRKK